MGRTFLSVVFGGAAAASIVYCGVLVFHVGRTELEADAMRESVTPNAIADRHASGDANDRLTLDELWSEHQLCFNETVQASAEKRLPDVPAKAKTGSYTRIIHEADLESVGIGRNDLSKMFGGNVKEITAYQDCFERMVRENYVNPSSFDIEQLDDQSANATLGAVFMLLPTSLSLFGLACVGRRGKPETKAASAPAP